MMNEKMKKTLEKMFPFHNPQVYFTTGILGIIIYPLLDLIILPSYKLGGMITVQIDLSIILVPVVAVFAGPVIGLLVGFFGSMAGDLLLGGHIIAYGGVNLAIGLLGFVTGLFHVYSQEKLNVMKYLGVLLCGILVASITFMMTLIVIANQNFQSTLLYNFMPFASRTLISILLYSPLVVIIVEQILKTQNIDYYKIS